MFFYILFSHLRQVSVTLLMWRLFIESFVLVIQHCMLMSHQKAVFSSGQHSFLTVVVAPVHDIEKGEVSVNSF